MPASRSGRSTIMAQEVHRNLVLTKGGTKAVATDEASRSLFDLGEPPWVKDEEVKSQDLHEYVHYHEYRSFAT